MNGQSGGSSRLDSWKAIAEYLGRDVRTAMRWHRRDGLPVHRIGDAPGRAVFAFTAEIDAWLTRHRTAPGPSTVPVAPVSPAASEAGVNPAASRTATHWRGRAALGAVGAVVIAAGVLAWGTLFAAGPAVRAEIAEDHVIVRDEAGREVWRRHLGHLVSASQLHHVAVADITRDGRADVIVSVVPWRPPPLEGESILTAFDDRGHQLWQRTLEGAVVYGGVSYGPPWYQDALVIYEVDGVPRVSGAFHHHRWWPDRVVTFDAATGSTVGEFVNAGWIYSLAVTPDGRHLLASGTNNALQASVLAALDTRQPSGASPASPVSPRCDDCPRGQPTAYLTWPRTHLADPARDSPTMTRIARDGTIEVRMLQRQSDGSPELVAYLSPDFSIVRETMSDSFKNLHRQLEDDGRVTHDLNHCSAFTRPR